jgi:hypothetical protein
MRKLSDIVDEGGCQKPSRSEEIKTRTPGSSKVTLWEGE